MTSTYQKLQDVSKDKSGKKVFTGNLVSVRRFAFANGFEIIEEKHAIISVDIGQYHHHVVTNPGKVTGYWLKHAENDETALIQKWDTTNKWAIVISQNAIDPEVAKVCLA